MYAVMFYVILNKRKLHFPLAKNVMHSPSTQFNHNIRTLYMYISICLSICVMQLVQGVRKCSNMKVPYLGDPLLQPVRSYENTWLVRCLHSWSLYLNDRVSPAAANVRYRILYYCERTQRYIMYNYWRMHV